MLHPNSPNFVQEYMLRHQELQHQKEMQRHHEEQNDQYLRLLEGLNSFAADFHNNVEAGIGTIEELRQLSDRIHAMMNEFEKKREEEMKELRESIELVSAQTASVQRLLKKILVEEGALG